MKLIKSRYGRYRNGGSMKKNNLKKWNNNLGMGTVEMILIIVDILTI